MNNLLLYIGLVDSRISASEKDLPVHIHTAVHTIVVEKECPIQQQLHPIVSVRELPFLLSDQ